jgi:menaquinone-9 beta-reductase
MPNLKLEPEILVIGAGPAGASAAWALAQQGHDVLMVDKSDFPRDKTCGDGLTPMAVRTLRGMGVAEKIEAAGAQRIDRIRLKGPFGARVEEPFTSFMQAGMEYALVLPRFIFDDLLRLHAVGGGAKTIGSVRIDAIERQGDRITCVRGSSPEGPIEIWPRQVILAVGANMGLLERAGFLKTKPRLMRAARSYFSGVKAVSNVYDFYFDFELIPGYGWIFPAGPDQYNVGAGTLDAFWTSRKTPQTLLSGFVQRRQKQGVMRDAVQEGAVKGFPLRTDFPSERVAGENWIIIGEATGLVNPVTGEGIDLAMESALLGAALLHEDLIHNRSNHIAYQRELWVRFAPFFNGISVLRDILVTPLVMDYVLWQIRHQRFMARSVLKMTQGMEAPQQIFHPLFILQFFMPISPALLLDLGHELFSPRRGG